MVKKSEKSIYENRKLIVTESYEVKVSLKLFFSRI